MGNILLNVVEVTVYPSGCPHSANNLAELPAWRHKQSISRCITGSSNSVSSGTPNVLIKWASTTASKAFTSVARTGACVVHP